MTEPSPLFAVVAVHMPDVTQGTVLSLHANEHDARGARSAYREDRARPQPDLYVVGPVPPETRVGSTVALHGGDSVTTQDT
jgi:hypothetical protein